ncbi:nuclear transport factor 2 family protein [Streptomyces sp. NBC_01275]|uniref:nuclear transport factor 2 family protein n=1 Tax=Streptomyces sp. NBC_01275 TaxID=2903807 RepID=UPI0022580F31|nr:nuclear transport factor 2 family protein [Streptomyces sp. NBC_01275]MCX4761530.1 nuclear transport factor 2 family protein [Streptomyces sp. NBC_01275]
MSGGVVSAEVSDMPTLRLPDVLLAQDTPVRLTADDVTRLVEDWFAALDRRGPVEDLLPFLVPRGLVLHVPEGVVREHEGFRGWHADTLRRFTASAHTLTSVDVRLNDGPSAEVRLTVAWEGAAHRLALGRRRRLAHEAHQTWTVARQDGAPRIRTLAVTGLTAMVEALPLPLPL